MAHLFDTNTFLRLAEKNNPFRQVVLNTIIKLRSDGEVLYYTPQILSEFWNVCTRPITVRSGLGLTIGQTERKVNLIQKQFELLPDNLSTFYEWRRLVSDHKIIGSKVHDAKLAASMIVHNITYLVTFNTRDFKRFQNFTVIDPNDISISF